MRRGLLAAVAATLSACSGPNGPGPGPGPGPPPTGVAILAGAGDIAECSSPGAEATAQLLDRISGTVFTAGDNAYPNGSPAQFRDCYDPSWGRHKRRTRPTPGNHDYEHDANASGYFDYFGDSAGPRGLGYYSYTVGSWRVYALNSEIAGGAAQLQADWLREELTMNPACSIAIWHKPLFTSGPNGPNPHMRETWRILHSANVDVVINGHDHLYERFAPQDPDGRPDARGMRQFTVGTGGVPLYSFGATRPNSEVRANVWGVLVLILGDGSYEWSFMPAGIPGANFRDAGGGACH